MQRMHFALPDDIAALLEQLCLRDGIKASKTAVVIAAIRLMARQRGFLDE